MRLLAAAWAANSLLGAPPPACPAFSCPKGQKAVTKGGHDYWTYGCKSDMGLNMMTMDDFDMNSADPMAAFKKKQKKQSKVNKCCVERDICRQTCGTSSVECGNAFNACASKVCKGNQQCELEAVMSDIMGQPYAAEDKDDDLGKPFEGKQCAAFDHAQQAVCECVPKTAYEDAVEASLAAFYGKHKLDDKLEDGKVKDMGAVWKKWKGKVPAMFQALASKYKVVTEKERPKKETPPYTPPPAKDPPKRKEVEIEDSSESFDDVEEEEL